MVLFLLGGGLTSRFRILPPKPQSVVGGKDDTLKAPKAGDLILCNLQSPLDVLAIRCALPTVFSGASEWSGALERGAVFAFYDPLGGARGAPIADFCPSPFQLWKAARYIRHLAKPDVILRMEHSVPSSTLSEVPPLPVDALQRRAVKLGIPVILFAEGTTSNGKAIMPFPRLQISTRRPATAKAAPQQIFLSAVHYPHAPAAACVLDQSSTPLPFLANVCARTELGSQATWTIARPSAAVDMALYVNPTGGSDASTTADTDYITTASWLLDCRSKMCALVQYRNPGVVCKPVTAGLQEKVGFVKQFLETMK
ncbi:Hypothetical protein, putative [Bodo saltans]|uniref:Uncharacterized protein n=1 Tax=Bodo saltans TaxID=75058 RepID=A0A0S4IZ96_BODSA|nr:Hypothetical protein, putative [Bodo saltans]|eukprot:CUG19206.1 Hypothetical protein, putative [Bodo saltans]